MAEAGQPRLRVSLTKAQLQSAAGAELLSLCQTVTEDGTISEQEVAALKTWLEDNRSSDLPSVGFLVATVEQIIADGKVTKEEHQALYRAVERILPAEARREATLHRRAIEEAEREHAKAEREEEKQRAREEKERKRPIASANFMVAGVRYEGRPDVIRRYVNAEDQVYLVRDRGNRHSRNAIEVRLRNGHEIGFVPEGDAVDLAPLLDDKRPHYARVTKILTGGRSPIPVVQAYIYHPDAGVRHAVFEANVPRASLGPWTIGCLTVIFLGLALFVFFAWFR